VECFVELTPDDTSTANAPKKAVITSGANSGSGSHIVNGYDDLGNPDPTMIETFTTLPSVNQDALRAFADYSFDELGNNEVDNYLSGKTSFWKDPPANTQPWIIHVAGDLKVSGNRYVFGIIFVEGDEVDIAGSARIHGVIYAPNATISTEIHGGGNPGDQPVMGQIIAGTGGVYARGNHADVQLVEEYVDAFNNFGGDIVDVEVVSGSWKQS